MPTDYVQQLLISVQHEFAGGILLDTSYVNTRGTNLNFATNINQAPVSELGCSGYNCGNPNPIFNSIALRSTTDGRTTMRCKCAFKKEMSYGVNFQFNYAWSKSLDTGTGNGHGSGIDIYQNAYNPAANYGLVQLQREPSTFVGQIVYELPFGNGRQFALHGPFDQIAGRLARLQRFPVALGKSVHAGDSKFRCTRASIRGWTPHSARVPPCILNVVGNPKVSNPTPSQWFNPAAYANPVPGTFGTSGRNTLIGPSFANADFSVPKAFAFRAKACGSKSEPTCMMCSITLTSTTRMRTWATTATAHWPIPQSAPSQARRLTTATAHHTAGGSLYVLSRSTQGVCTNPLRGVGERRFLRAIPTAAF
jgi:hypothetical protein